MNLRQGNRRVADYAIEFHTLSAVVVGTHLPWLMHLFMASSSVKDQLISVACELWNTPKPDLIKSSEEPMQLGRTRLGQEERTMFS